MTKCCDQTTNTEVKKVGWNLGTYRCQKPMITSYLHHSCSCDVIPSSKKLARTISYS